MMKIQNKVNSAAACHAVDISVLVTESPLLKKAITI